MLLTIADFSLSCKQHNQIFVWLVALLMFECFVLYEREKSPNSGLYLTLLVDFATGNLQFFKMFKMFKNASNGLMGPSFAQGRKIDFSNFSSTGVE